jgi:cobalt/nickel transport system permease protein
MGANIFNMGIVGVAVSYFVYRTFTRLSGGKRWGIFTGGFGAAWFSIVAASLAVALQLALSGRSPANIAIPAMGGIHMLIGIGEGLITVGALTFLYAARRDLLRLDGAVPQNANAVWLGGLAIAVLLAVFSPLASKHPDGLNRVAMQNGFIEAAQGPLYRLLPNYAFPGISNAALATIVSAIVGILIVFGTVLAVAWMRRTSKASN